MAKGNTAEVVQSYWVDLGKDGGYVKQDLTVTQAVGLEARAAASGGTLGRPMSEAEIEACRQIAVRRGFPDTPEDALKARLAAGLPMPTGRSS